jgi:glycosyltransferase involved in cell wall biosynthesis
LAWARQIVVLDSGSTDRTASLIKQFENATVVERPFDNHTAQWNFGLEQVQTPWVLALDADYVCPPSLVEELRSLGPDHDAYAAGFRYCIDGRPLRGTLYPARVVLFRADRFQYVADGHTQTLQVAGDVGKLKSVLLHDDRKPLARWLADQNRYAELEAVKLLSASASELEWKDRLRKRILWAAPATFFYCLFLKGLVFDGWPGIYYTLQRVYAELLLSMKLLDRKLRGAPSAG